MRPHGGLGIAAAASLLLATGSPASEPAVAPLAQCRLALGAAGGDVVPGDELPLELAADCGGRIETGLAVELALEAEGRAWPLASLDGVALGDAPLLLPVANAEGGCFAARVTRGAERATARACLQPVSLALPALPPRTSARGAAPGTLGLARCRLLAVTASPRSFHEGDALDFAVSAVCPEAVPRVRVALERTGRADPHDPIAVQGDVALRKGVTTIALAGGDYRAGRDCLRVRAERAGQSIEGTTCVRPRALRLTSHPGAETAR